MLDEYFVPGDTADGARVVQEQQIQAKDEKRPYVIADIGAPYGVVSIIFPPDKSLEGKQLTYNQLIQVMRNSQVIPVQLGLDWRFLPWDEARALFDSLFDKHLYENFNIIPTDKVGGNGNNQS